MIGRQLLVVVFAMSTTSATNMASMSRDTVFTKQLFETLGAQPRTLVREFAKMAPELEIQLQSKLDVVLAKSSRDPDMSTECLGCQVKNLLNKMYNYYVRDSCEPMVSLKIITMLFVL